MTQFSFIVLMALHAPLVLSRIALLQALDPPLKNIVWVALDEGSKAFMEASFAGALISHDQQKIFSSLSTQYRTPEYNR